MDFIFKSLPETSFSALRQGDILKRTPELQDALNEAHRYYAEATDYTHFMVLTQSCNLVPRYGKVKTRYITLAAVRPISELVDRLVDKYKFRDFLFPFPVCAIEHESLVSQLLERLIHNTEIGHFFIRKNSHPRIVEDLCVFLALSVPLSVKHLQPCLSSKIAELTDIFQAKVGWLTGNLYSHVGTPDIEEGHCDPEAFKKNVYDDVLYKKTAWMSPAQLKTLKGAVSKWKKENPDGEINEAIARELVETLPTDVEIIVERVVRLLSEEKLLRDEADMPDIRGRAKTTLANDNAFKRLLQSSTSINKYRE